jgi:hypothetical protein
MRPSELKPEHFNRYPLEAGELARSYVPIFRQLPLAFIPLLLREVISYDWQFPVEKAELQAQLRYLGTLSAAQRSQLMTPFANLQLPKALKDIDWVNSPEVFNTQLSAVLWTTTQIGQFTAASENYIKGFYTSKAPVSLPLPRFTLVSVGRGVSENRYPLFRKLRRQGTYYTQVKTENGVRLAVDALGARSETCPIPFGHWYISGADEDALANSRMTYVSYGALSQVRAALLEKMTQAIQSGRGLEALHAELLKLQPGDFGLAHSGDQGILNHFKVNVLTQGSGTQIFSTSFVEWTAREAMRRAQPITMFVRFAPRRRSASMDEMISESSQEMGVDPQGSLIDADMGSYYIWLNQCRLPGANASSFLVWFEEHGIACCVSPLHKPGTESDQPVDLAQLIRSAGSP